MPKRYQEVAQAHDKKSLAEDGDSHLLQDCESQHTKGLHLFDFQSFGKTDT